MRNRIANSVDGGPFCGRAFSPSLLSNLHFRQGLPKLLLTSLRLGQLRGQLVEGLARVEPTQFRRIRLLRLAKHLVELLVQGGQPLLDSRSIT